MQLRSDMFEAIIRREIGYFDKEENSTGELTARLANDSRLVSKATGFSFAKLVQAFFTVALGMGLVFSASWQITLIIIACFPLIIGFSAVQQQALKGQQYDKVDENTEKKPKKDSKSTSSFNLKEKNNVPEEEATKAPAPSASGQISTAFNHMRTVSAFSMQFKVAEDYEGASSMVAADRKSRSIVAGFA